MGMRSSVPTTLKIKDREMLKSVQPLKNSYCPPRKYSLLTGFGLALLGSAETLHGLNFFLFLILARSFFGSMGGARRGGCRCPICFLH